MSRRALLGVALTLACRRRLTSEDEVRRLVVELEAAVRERDVGAAGRLISTQYRDAERDRGQVLGLLRPYLMRHPSLHLLVKVVAIDVDSPDRARATLLAAVASLPIAGPGDLGRVGAELVRFDLELAREEGAFRVRGATWRPARAEDFF